VRKLGWEQPGEGKRGPLQPQTRKKKKGKSERQLTQTAKSSFGDIERGEARVGDQSRGVTEGCGQKFPLGQRY